MELTRSAPAGLRNRLGTGWALTAMLAVASTGCGVGGDDVDGFSTEEWKAVQAMEPLSTEMPRNPFNKKDQDMAVAKLGQMLFYETGYAQAITVSGPSGMVGETGKISCVNCHDPNQGWVDSRPGPTSHGRTGFGKRNAPTMANLGWYDWYGWTGRHDSMVMHGSGVMGTGGTPLFIANFLWKYRDEYDRAFPETPLDPALNPALDPADPDAGRFPASGGPKANAMAADGPFEMMAEADQKAIYQIQANMGRVWDTYPRKLVNKDSPFQRYVRDRDFGALSASAKAGLKLFVGKAACNDCHTGPLLADNSWHNIGVPDPPGATAPDMGRFADMPGTLTHMFNAVGAYSDDPEAGRLKHMTMPIGDESMRGAFRTPMLINIAQTAPYFHTGLAATLEDVVRHYNKGGGEAGTFAGTKDTRLRPLNLSEQEIADLVEFMKSLTGAAVDEEWSANISKP